MRYHQGDEVVLKVEDDFGYTDKTYRCAKVTVLSFDADVDADDAQYICYVPSYESVPKSFTIRRMHVDWYELDGKYLGENACFITSKTPIYRHLPATPGACCERCKEFFEGASSFDSKFRCTSCTTNPWR